MQLCFFPRPRASRSSCATTISHFRFVRRSLLASLGACLLAAPAQSQTAPVFEAPIASASKAATAAIQSELSSLRAWSGRLRAERVRIQREIEQAQQEGRAAEFTDVGWPSLLHDLSAVVWALDESTTCEMLANKKYGDVSPAVRVAELLGKSSTVEA